MVVDKELAKASKPKLDQQKAMEIIIPGATFPGNVDTSLIFWTALDKAKYYSKLASKPTRVSANCDRTGP